MFLKELQEEYLLNLEILGRAEGTIYNYKYAVRLFIDFMSKENNITRLESVKPIHIKQLILYWKNDKKWAHRTINKMIGLIKVMFNYAVDEEYLSELDNPFRRIKKLKETKTIIVSFNDDEVRRMIDSCRGSTYSNIRDKLILMMLFDLGIRVSELTHLKSANVKEGHILIKGKGDKERFLYVSPILKRQIMKFNRTKKKRFLHKKTHDMEEYFFLNQSGQQLSRSRINKILNEHAEIAGVREEIRVSPHTCRHYFAHAQLRNGIDVYSLSRLMGHYDTSITSDYLKGLQDNDVLQKGMQSSPLTNLK